MNQVITLTIHETEIGDSTIVLRGVKRSDDSFVQYTIKKELLTRYLRNQGYSNDLSADMYLSGEISLELNTRTNQILDVLGGNIKASKIVTPTKGSGLKSTKVSPKTLKDYGINLPKIDPAIPPISRWYTGNGVSTTQLNPTLRPTYGNTIPTLPSDRTKVPPVSTDVPKQVIESKKEGKKKTSNPIISSSDDVPKKKEDYQFAYDESYGILPTQMPVFMTDPLETRIGYTVINAPITSVMTSKKSMINESPALRSLGGFKQPGSSTYETFTITIKAAGGDQVYNSILQVLEQINLHPILCVEGGLFPHKETISDPNGKTCPIPYNELVVRSFALSTLPETPGGYQLDIQVDPFIWNCWAPMSGESAVLNGDESQHEIINLGDGVSWPIYKIWCKHSARSKWVDNKRITLTLPDRNQTSGLTNMLSFDSAEDTGSDEETLKTLANLIGGGDWESKISNDYKEPTGREAIKKKGVVTSDNVKRYPTFNDEAQVYAVKINTRENFYKVYSDLAKFTAGLTEWSAYNWSLGGAEGERIPEQVDLASLLTPNSYGNRYQSTSADIVIDRADVNPLEPTGVRANSLLASAIEEYFVQKEFNRLIPTINPLSNPEAQVRAEARRNVEATVSAAISNPQDFFGLVIDADANKRSELLLAIKKSDISSEIALGSDSYNTGISKLFENSPDPNSGHVLDITEEPIFTITAISANGGWNVSVVNVDSQPLPQHQCLGAASKTIAIEGVTTEAGKHRLNTLYNKFLERAIGKKAEGYDGARNAKTDYDFRKSTVSPTLIKIDSEFTELLGIDFVMPLGFEFKAIPGVPDKYTFVLSFIDFDPRSKLAEQLKTLNTFNQANTTTLKYNDALRNSEDPYPTWLKAVDWASLQGALRSEELLPDLFLPTKDMLRSWVSAIKALGENPESTDPNHKIIKGWLSEFFTTKASYESFRYYDPKFQNESSGKYVEADFWLYYNDDGWKSYVDLICRIQLGERNGLDSNPESILAADDRGSAYSALRLRETFDGQDDSVTLTSIISPTQLTGHSDRLMTHLNERFNNVYTEDGTLATDLITSRDESLAATKAVGKQLGWWIGDGEMKDNIVSWSNSQDLTRMMNLGGLPSKELDSFYVPFEDKGDQDVIMNPSDSSGQTPMDRASNEQIRRFFSIGFRLKALRRALLTNFDYSSIPQSIDTHILTKHPETFMLNVENRAMNTFETVSGRSDEVLGTTFESRVFLKPSEVKTKGLNKTLWTPDEYLDEVSKQLHLDSNSSDILRPYGGFTADNRLNFFNKVCYYNWYLSKHPKGSAIKAREIANTSEEDFGEQEMRNVISEALRVDVPPSILFAFFNARTGFGRVSPAGGTGGWGDLDLTRLNTTSPVGTSSIDAINIFAEYWHKAVSLYQSNTVRILYCHIMLTKAFNSYGANKEKYDSLLKEADKATTVSNHLRGIRQVSIEIGNSYPLDAYYDSWLSWARSGGLENTSNGGVVQTTNDIFFTINNPYLAIDIGNMANSEKHVWGNTTARSLETDYTPSGQKTYINLDRGRTGLNALRKIGNLENTTYSLEEQGKILIKQRYALFPSSTQALYGMLLDMRNFSGFGRLRSFYPTFFMSIINEGFYWKGGVEKLWDHYYTRTALSNIELVSSIETPTAICTITLSNVFRTLQRYKAETVFLEEQALEEQNTQRANVLDPGKIAYELFNRQLLKKFDNTLKGIWERNYLNTFVLKPGARIHLRMGYGSNAAALPTVFNGTVSEVPVGDDTVTIVAYSDGEELNKQIAVGNTQTNNGWVWKNSGAFGRAKSPANIVTESLIQVDGWKSLASERLNPFPGLMTRDMSHGIAHFGDLYMDGLRFFPAELAVNIYDSSPVLDQTPDSDFWNNYGTYDWNAKKTYFNVSVNEATPYKVLDVCRRAVSDFVGFPTYFGTESRVFYGKWWWPAHYSYSAETISQFAPNVQLLKGKAGVEIGVNSIIFTYVDGVTTLTDEDKILVQNLQSLCSKGLISYLDVLDGDTIAINSPSLDRKISFRFANTDAPESDQPFGLQARDVLRNLLLDKSIIKIHITGKEYYGRFLAEVSVESNEGSLNVELEMLSAGMTNVAYIDSVDRVGTMYSQPAKIYSEAEKEAKDNKVGLWSDEKPIHPRIWRRGGKFLISQGPQKVTQNNNTGGALGAMLSLYNIGSIGGNLPSGIIGALGAGVANYLAPSDSNKGYWENFGRQIGAIATLPFPINISGLIGIASDFYNFNPVSGVFGRVGALADELKTGEELAAGNDPTSAIRDVDYLVKTLNWKPYTQVYFAQSGLNLIQNSVKADASKVFTDAIGIQTFNGFASSDTIERTISYCVDDDIIPACRKTLSVDTGLYLTAESTDAMDNTRRVTGKILGVVPGLNTMINKTPTTPMVYNSVINTLAEHVAYMYGGWITIKGAPTMKPRDLIFLNCSKTGLTGPVRAKSIIHRLDLQNGLVTFVSPMAVTVPAGTNHTTTIITTLLSLMRKLAAYTVTRTLITPLLIWGMLGRGMKRASINQAGDILYNEYRMAQLKRVAVGTSNDFATQETVDKFEDLFKVELASKSGNTKNPTTAFDSVRSMLEEREKISNEKQVLQATVGSDPTKIPKDLTKKIKNLELDQTTLTNKLTEIRDEYAKVLQGQLRAEELKGITGDKGLIEDLKNRIKTVSETDFDGVDSPWPAYDVSKKDLLADLARNNPDIEGFRAKIREKLELAGKRLGLLDEDLKEIFGLDKEFSESIEDFDDAYQRAIRDRLASTDINQDDIIRQVRHEKAKLFECIFDELEADPNIARFLTDSVDEDETVKFIAQYLPGELDIDEYKQIQKALREAGKVDATSFRKLLHELKKPLPNSTIMDTKPLRFWDHASPFHPFKRMRESLQAAKLRTEGASFSSVINGKVSSIMSFSVAVKESWAAKNMDAIKALYSAEKTAKAAKSTARTTATAFRIGMFAGPQALLGIAKEIVMFVLGDSFASGLNERLRARQCVKIYPLFVGKTPYTAGILGHAGAVVGDEPGWFDNIVLNTPVGSALLFVGAFFGVEFPEEFSVPTEEDRSYRSSQGVQEPGIDPLN